MEKVTLSLKKMDCFFDRGKDGCLFSISFLKNPFGFQMCHCNMCALEWSQTAADIFIYSIMTFSSTSSSLDVYRSSQSCFQNQKKCDYESI